MRLRRGKGRRPPAATQTTAGPPVAPPARQAAQPAGPVLSALADVVAILREILVWPVRLWLGAAKVAGRPAYHLRLRMRDGFEEDEFVDAQNWLWVASRKVAPIHAFGAKVTSQTLFSDYRTVEVGAPSYKAVENVAPAPQVDRQSPRSAHGVIVFVIAVAALFVTVFAVGRNWRLARLLIFLGAAVILICLLVDAPEGLREGSAALDYEGAKATLLGGFWVQLWSAVTLALVGPLLATQLRSERAAL